MATAIFYRESDANLDASVSKLLDVISGQFQTEITSITFDKEVNLTKLIESIESENYMTLYKKIILIVNTFTMPEILHVIKQSNINHVQLILHNIRNTSDDLLIKLANTDNIDKINFVSVKTLVKLSNNNLVKDKNCLNTNTYSSNLKEINRLIDCEESHIWYNKSCMITMIIIYFILQIGIVNFPTNLEYVIGCNVMRSFATIFSTVMFGMLIFECNRSSSYVEAEIRLKEYNNIKVLYETYND